jgi:hypothetical protein
MRGLSLHFHHPTKPNDDDQMIGFLDSLPCKTNVVKGRTVYYSSKKNRVRTDKPANASPSSKAESLLHYNTFLF